jgi:hypothetical protein
MNNNSGTVEHDTHCSIENLEYQGAVGTANKECKNNVLEALVGDTLTFCQVNNNPGDVELDKIRSRENLVYHGVVGTKNKECTSDEVEASDCETSPFCQVNNNPGVGKHVELCFRDKENKECKIYVEDIDSEALPFLQESNIVDKIIKAYERSLRNKT